MSVFAILALAMLLDAALGEPRWLWDRVPHPAVAAGRAVGWFDRRWNERAGEGARRRLRGAAMMAGLGLAAIALGWAVGLGGPLAEIAALAALLAHRSLVEHVGAVADGLDASLEEGRGAVGLIVGRDTAGMEESEVARAAIESAAENLSDAVVAPALWFLVAGLPGLFLCKMVNTADSMVGYRTERHEAFGWAAARLDDLMNAVPARLTAVGILLVHGRMDAVREVEGDAGLHRSPNAGWPEAAMARVLGVALAGPRSYGGTVADYPHLNGAGRMELGADDVRASVSTLWRVWAAGFAATAAVVALAAMVAPDIWGWG